MSTLHRTIHLMLLAGALLVGAVRESWAAEAASKPEAKPQATPRREGSDKPRPGGKPAGVRTLSEVPIHGELGVTQVLFITGRDQHRYFDFLIARYLLDASALAADLVLPGSVGVAGVPAIPAAPASAPEARPSPEGQ